MNFFLILREVEAIGINKRMAKISSRTGPVISIPEFVQLIHQFVIQSGEIRNDVFCWFHIVEIRPKYRTSCKKLDFRSILSHISYKTQLFLSLAAKMLRFLYSEVCLKILTY